MRILYLRGDCPVNILIYRPEGYPSVSEWQMTYNDQKKTKNLNDFIGCTSCQGEKTLTMVTLDGDKYTVECPYCAKKN